MVAGWEQLYCGAIDGFGGRTGTWKHEHCNFQTAETQQAGLFEDEVESAGTRSRWAEISRDLRNRGSKCARRADSPEARNRRRRNAGADPSGDPGGARVPGGLCRRTGGPAAGGSGISHAGTALLGAGPRGSSVSRRTELIRRVTDQRRSEFAVSPRWREPFAGVAKTIRPRARPTINP